MRFLRVIVLAGLCLLASCKKPLQPTELVNLAGTEESYSQNESTSEIGVADPFLSEAWQSTGHDTIPDFSRTGYRWGDAPIPDYQNIVNVPPPSGADDRAAIQTVIDNAPANSVIQFQSGEYRVDSILFLDRSYLILRGAADGSTVIRATGKSLRNLIEFGRTARDANGNRIILRSQKSIKGVNTTVHYTIEYSSVKSSTRSLGANVARLVEGAYCGDNFVTVDDPSDFSVGDRIVLFRPATEKWLDAIHMREIGQDPLDEDVIVQWGTSSYNLQFERRIIGMQGTKILLDNPVAMSVTSEYGGGYIRSYSWSKVVESGVENLTLKSDYYKGEDDEEHALHAINIFSAEHCWVKNVQSWHFSTSCVDMGVGAQNISVLNCVCNEPKGPINGGYRYAFHCSSSQLCLVKDCVAYSDRHAFVTGSRACGPNAFVDCTSLQTYSILGPHQRWATAGLYDRCYTDTRLVVEDAGESGTGHGWQGANFVFWNCKAENGVLVQSPWVSARNYAIGCGVWVGADEDRQYYDSLGRRPAGFVRDRQPSEPESLYAWQLEQRHASGLNINSIIAR